MCIEDYRIGTLIRAVTTKQLINTPDEVAFPPNLARVGITFFGAPEGQYQLFIDAQTSAFGTGILVNEGAVPFHFTLVTHGELPRKAFTVLASIANISLQTVEYFLPLKVIAADPPGPLP